MALRVTRCMKSPARPNPSSSVCSVLSVVVSPRIVSRWRRLAVALRWLALAGVATPVQAAEGVLESIELLRSRDYPAYKIAISRLQKKGAEAVPELLVAIEKLKVASRDPEINVRKEALLALQRLTHLPGETPPAAESGPGSTNGWAWKASGPLLLPGPAGGETWLSLKDPSVVRHHDRWHLFCTVRGTRRSHAILHTSFAEWAEAQTAPRQILNCHTGYFCAPQVFFFTPRQEWYLVCQASDPSWTPPYQPAFATTKKVEDPGGWSPLRPMWTDPSTAPKAWLDFWVICDTRKAHLFYTSLDGKMWRAETALDRFPLGWSPPVLAIEGDIFEASHTYRLRGMNRYLTFVEAQDGHGWRYFKSFVAAQLEGPWIPQAAERDPAFASMRNVSQPSPRWTDAISHGELLRSGVDEHLEIEPASLRMVFQGVLDSDRADKPYGQIPWRLGLMESTSVPALR